MMEFEAVKDFYCFLRVDRGQLKSEKAFETTSQI